MENGLEKETVPVPLERLEGKYEILEKIREGGMGSIYKVRHRLLDEVRVIKVIRPQLQRDESLNARFQREARNAIRLRHNNIAQLYDFAVDEEGNAFIVMEFIAGLTLDELLRRAGPPSVGLALEVARQTLEALAYLHRKNLVHRDISPDNLMLTREEDGTPLIKLIDLGLAKGLQDESSLTMQGTFLGKVRYASPEQFRVSAGDRPDQRSDIYSFAVVLYELLTGALPIRGESLSALIGGHLFDEPVPFADSDPGERVPDELRAAVLRALAKRPEERFQTAKSFAETLARIQPYHPVTAFELERLFRESVPPGPAGAASPPGSMQERLDARFAVGATPPPADDPSRAATRPLDLPGPAAKTPSRPLESSKVDRALAEIEASLATRKKLGPPPRSTPVAPPPEPAGGVADGELLAPRTEKRLAAVVAAVEERLAAGDWDASLAAVERAEAELEAGEELASLRGRIAAVRAEAERRNALVTATRDVEALLGEGDVTGARAALAEARFAGAADAELERLAARIGEVAGAAERRRREEAVAEAKRRVEAALAAGDTEEAGRALAVAGRLFPDDGDLLELGLRLEEVQGRLRAERVAQLLATATAAAAAGALERAVGVIQEAQTVDPTNQELQQRLHDLRRRQALDAVRASLRRGDVAAAESAFRLAERLYGAAPDLAELREHIEERKITEP